MTAIRRVYFTMVSHPSGRRIRVGNAFKTRKDAREWVPFVRSAWLGLPVQIEACTLRFVDGTLDEVSAKVLSERYNLDPPAIL